MCIYIYIDLYIHICMYLYTYIHMYIWSTLSTHIIQEPRERENSHGQCEFPGVRCRPRLPNINIDRKPWFIWSSYIRSSNMAIEHPP